jgi:hypothetical protein
MEMVDSKKQLLSIQQIIKIALAETGSDLKNDVATAAIVKELTLPRSMSIKINNTVFIVHQSEKDLTRGIFRALNADTARNYFSNSQEFINKMKKIGFTVLASQFSSPSILNIFTMIGKKPPFPQMGLSVRKSKNGTFMATINMGGAK